MRDAPERSPPGAPAHAREDLLPAALPAGPRLLRRGRELWSTGWPGLDRALLRAAGSAGRFFVSEREPLEPSRLIPPLGSMWLPPGVAFHAGLAGLNELARRGPLGGYAYELRLRWPRVLCLDRAEDVRRFQAAHGEPGDRYDWGAVAASWSGVLVRASPGEFGLAAPGGWVWGADAVAALWVVHEPPTWTGGEGAGTLPPCKSPR